MRSERLGPLLVLSALTLSGCCPPSGPPPEVYVSAGYTRSVQLLLQTGVPRPAFPKPALSRLRPSLAARLDSGDVPPVVVAPGGIYVLEYVEDGEEFWTFCPFGTIFEGFGLYHLMLMGPPFGNSAVVGGYGYPNALRHLSLDDFSSKPFTGLPEGSFISDLASGDLDGDGEDEALVAYQSNGSVSGGLAACSLRSLTCNPFQGLPSSVAFGSGGQSILTLEQQLQDGSSVPRALLAGMTTGVFRSTDRGGTWQQATGLPLTPNISALERSGTAVFALTSNVGLQRSTDEGGSFTRVDGGLPASLSPTALLVSGDSVFTAVTVTGRSTVYRSTNGGQTFTAGTSFAGRSVNSLSLDGSSLWAFTDSGAWVSRDGGATFTKSSKGLVSASFGALAVAADGSVYAGGYGGPEGVVTTRDKGVRWTSGTGGEFTLMRSLAPSGTNVLASSFSGTFRSTDGGATFAVTTPTGLTGGVNAVASVGGTILAGVSGGAIHRSTDGGATFGAAATGTVAGTTVQCIATSGSTVVVGRTGGVSISTDGGATFRSGGPVAAGSTTGYLVSSAAVSGNEILVGSLATDGNGAKTGVFRSTDAGQTFTDVSSGSVRTGVNAVAIAGSRLFAGAAGGLFVSENAGASWTAYDQRLSGTSIAALAATSDRLYVGTLSASVWTLPLTARQSRLVPIVLDVGSGAARFTTELALTNRGPRAVPVTARYTASLGSGSGSGTTSIGAGQQLVLPDAIAWLKDLGVPIAEGTAAGTLLLEFEGVTDAGSVAATARTAAGTASPQPQGRAGLAYPGFDPAFGAIGSQTVWGLRQNDDDRSNLAVFNTSAEPVTLKVTAYGGEGNGATVVVAEAETLPPYGWKQFNQVLSGMATGWVTVTRVSATGAFGCYGVINDNGTNDGSFVFPVTSLLGGRYLTVPVLVEAGAFRSELVFANSSASPATFVVSYRESLTGTGGGTARFSVPAKTQLILPDALQALRARNVPIGPPGASYAGSLHVDLEGVDAREAFAGARTAALSPAAGQFGLFTPALYPGDEAGSEAWLYGLGANDESRANVAVANTATSEGATAVTLELTAYDGDHGGVASGDATVVTLEPGRWTQIGDFLRGKGVANGWVRVRRTQGTSPWLAYGVVNDGGRPGERTGDGAYVPMTR